MATRTTKASWVTGEDGDRDEGEKDALDARQRCDAPATIELPEGKEVEQVEDRTGVRQPGEEALARHQVQEPAGDRGGGAPDRAGKTNPGILPRRGRMRLEANEWPRARE